MAQAIDIDDAIVNVFEGFNYPHHSHLLSFTHRCAAEMASKPAPKCVDVIYLSGDSQQPLPGTQTSAEQILVNSTDELFRLLKRGSPRLVIVHGQYRDTFWTCLLRCPNLWSRTIWVVWGGDLEWLADAFDGRLSSRTLRRRVKLAACGRLLLPRLHTIGVLMPEDGNILSRCFPGLHNIRRLFYPSVNIDLGITDDVLAPKRRSTVVCGNSGLPNNDHVGLIDLARSIDNRETQWLFPLVYGPTESIAAVCGYGHCMMGSSFLPMRDRVPYADFCRIFLSAHALIFNHRFSNRSQQGLGTLFLAMQHGSKVYIRSDNPLFRQLREWGAVIYDTLELNRSTASMFYEPISPEVVERNRCTIHRYFSEEAARSEWRQALAPQ